MYYNSVIEAVGNTPLVKLQKIAKDVPGTVLAKVEYFNPGQSIKDRIAIKMIDDAEAKGLIKPGGTIIEGTSGNTGMGLALVAIQRGDGMVRFFFSPGYSIRHNEFFFTGGLSFGKGL